MANIIGLLTVNNKTILELDEDPKVNGVDAPIGSIAMVNINNVGQQFIKVGPNPLDWDVCIQKGYVSQNSLTENDIVNKYITLPGVPVDPTSVLVDVLCGGGPAVYGQDYIVSGKRLIWSGLGLDPVLDSTDSIRVFYVS